MRKYLAAMMTGLLLLGTSPAVFGGHKTPRTVEEKRMQMDYEKRKMEKKAFRADLKKQQDAINAMRKSKSGKK